MTSLLEKIQTLQKTKDTIAGLEAAIQQERPAALARLPEQYGFTSVNDFTKAVTAASRGLRQQKQTGKTRAKAAPRKRAGKRARITDETRKQVKEMILAGKSGSAIAAAVGISLPSVQNIKKALGLTKPRSADAPSAA